MSTETSKTRVGIELKVVLIMTLVVVGAAVGGGVAYFETVRATLRLGDTDRGYQAARTLSLAVSEPLKRTDRSALQQMATRYADRNRLRYVSILSVDGHQLARSMRGGEDWSSLADRPVSVREVNADDPDAMVVIQPIIDARKGLIGGLRIVVDTSGTTAQLKRTQRKMAAVAVCIVLAMLPLGHLLAWRLIVQPVGKLVHSTRRLAAGDLSARSNLHSDDEIGQLGHAFDDMAVKIAAQRAALVAANEGLEQKVNLRTAELLEANQRLTEAMADKDDFLRAVSHDLNAPLRNISGMVAMITMKWKDQLPEDVLGRLQRIVANVETETSLLGELLELSRIKTQRQTPAIVDVNAMIDGLSAMFEYDLQSRSIALTADENLPTLHVEETRLRQVFQNLIDNAIKYMDRPAGGRIHVGYQCTDDAHEFSVTDNGPGVPDDHRDRIFFVFRRVEGRATASVEGKGVGLAVVRSIAQTYDGRAWVEQADGGGARFVFTLSRESTAEPAAARAAA